MAGLLGFIIGIGVGLWLCFLFIFPPDVLNIKLLELTIGEFLRIWFGLGISVLVGICGAVIGSFFNRD